jgi:choline dehydrogenase
VKTDAEIDAWVKKTAWGHHATGTAAFSLVVDGDFRVKGTHGLWVVDNSLPLDIPGRFPVVHTYMLGEKAGDVIPNATDVPE